ncbi:GNAT family N-acetyltransferase [Dysgonomonas sp. Marseille-P4677]|uniref:GNAT family N-acetyltransferase n=1 Tax=Dysgonomonas sp. Marseille-P4677 TaxID=2364790 RepID=UPI0019147726|nr:GNAT family protein [Dysgonomonas sp. Marseille-P4677]MBK5721964.1 GNAT family N-acetyltransferase [Dysgonomonas sp. Marseille-P4677]
MLLGNNTITLRAVEPEDLDILYSWENETTLWIHGNTLAPYSKLVLRQYINDALEMDIYQSKQLRLMIAQENQKKTVGTVDLYDIDAHNRRAGIGILIDQDYRQQGIASQALTLIKEYAFDFLYLHQLYAYISVSNLNSIKLFEKSGYKEVGILKDWLQRGDRFEDVHLLQLTNNK